MPAQIDRHNYVGYSYMPDYLKDNFKYISDYHKVTSSLNAEMTILETDIVIDGGNIVVGGDGKVIMTEKVFSENPGIDKKELLHKLKTLFNSEVIILPWDRVDKYGHTDGIVRPIDSKSVLVNLDLFPKRYADGMRKVLEKHYEVIDLSLPTAHKESWAYINSLQTDKIIIIPGLGIDSDAAVIEQYKTLFPQYGDCIYMIPMGNFVEEYGGALNCLTWTVCRDSTKCGKALLEQMEAPYREMGESRIIQDGPAFMAEIECYERLINKKYEQ